MRLTTKTDYCLRVLIYLQRNSGRVKIQQIADDYKISKNHLSIAVNKLSELGYIHTTSGPNGGIEFNSDCSKKKVGELVTEIENFDIVECFNSKTNSCSLSRNCKLKKMLSSATKAFTNELMTYEIKDLI